MEEGAFAVAWGGAAVQFYEESEWKRSVDTMGAIRNSKVAMMSHTQLTAGQSGMDNLGKPVTFWQTLWYSLGSFLISKNDDLGNAYFMFHGPAGYSKFWWFDEYDKINLGKATMPTRIEQTAPSSVTYTAGWFQDGSSRPWSGGSAACSTTAGAQATLSFTGTSVSWIGARGPQTGIARVLLDGALVAEVDTYKTTEEIQANVFSATGLAAGKHTLTIEVTGRKNAASTDTYIVVDAFDVNPYRVTTAVTANGPANVYWREFEKGYVYVNPTPQDVASVPLLQPGRQLTHDNVNSPAESIPIVGAIALNSHNAAILLKTPVKRLQEDDAAVRSSPAGAWVLRGPEVAAFSGGAAGGSNVPSAAVALSFTGTAVSWIGLECSVCGIATVSIDGGARTPVNTAGAAAPGTPGLASKAVFTASGLAAGTHSLVITVTGTTTSGGAHIVIDAFDVTP
jgi:hypothetical protein